LAKNLAFLQETLTRGARIERGTQQLYRNSGRSVGARMGVKSATSPLMPASSFYFIGWPKNVLALDISASHFVNCSGVKNLTTCSRIWSRAAASFRITSTRVTPGFLCESALSGLQPFRTPSEADSSGYPRGSDHRRIASLRLRFWFLLQLSPVQTPLPRRKAAFRSQDTPVPGLTHEDSRSAVHRMGSEAPLI